MDYKIAIVGPKEMVLGFKGLGLEVHDAESQSAAEEVLFELKKQTITESSSDRYAIVFVLESFIKNLDREKYQKLSQGALPAFIPIPGLTGSTGFGDEKIRRIVEKAVGSDIFA